MIQTVKISKFHGDRVFCLLGRAFLIKFYENEINITTMMMIMMIMNGFCGMVDQRKVFSLISSWEHCLRSSPLKISDMPRAGFQPAQNLSSGFV